VPAAAAAAAAAAPRRPLAGALRPRAAPPLACRTQGHGASVCGRRCADRARRGALQAWIAQSGRLFPQAGLRRTAPGARAHAWGPTCLLRARRGPFGRRRVVRQPVLPGFEGDVVAGALLRASGRDQATASAGRGSSCWPAREPPTGRRARRGATRLLPEAAPGGGGGAGRAACAERALIPASLLAGPLRAGAHQRQRRRRVRRVEGALLHGRERQREKRAVRGAAALTVQPALLTGRLVFTNPHSGAGCAASACDHTSARGESSRRPEKRPCLPKRPTCKQLPHFCGRNRAPANPEPLAPGAPHVAAAAAAVRPDAYRSRGEHGHHASSGVGVRRHGRKLRAETRRSARTQLRQAAPRPAWRQGTRHDVVRELKASHLV
jgi:hypothetical protein